MVRVLFVVCFFVLVSSPVKAHPHAWIDLETTLIFDEEGRVTALHVGWLFDDFYSAFSLDGLEGSQEQLNELAEINLKNLKEYHYFTQIRVDGQPVAIDEVETYNTQLIDNRLWLDFIVPLETPINPKEHKVSYAVYDPTYYVEVLYAQEGDPIRLDGRQGDCAYQLSPPKPPEDIATLAAAMDKTETAGDTIGIYFAEWVELTCD